GCRGQSVDVVRSDAARSEGSAEFRDIVAQLVCPPYRLTSFAVRNAMCAADMRSECARPESAGSPYPLTFFGIEPLISLPVKTCARAVYADARLAQIATGMTITFFLVIGRGNRIDKRFQGGQLVRQVGVEDGPQRCRVID